jgi:histidine triad (HIT) family protein
MDDCIFCKLVAQEIPSHVVYEDQDSISFLEINPSAPGHLMVILRKHGRSILDYNQDELGKLMASVSIVAKKQKSALNCDSITIGINHLEAKGVPHLHIHLIPRWNNDKGGAIQNIVDNKQKETQEEIAEKIRKA